MKNLMRAWGVPVGFLSLWVIAAAWTVHALAGMQQTTMPVLVAPPVEIVAPRAVTHGS